jgi:hypothetical protein
MSLSGVMKMKNIRNSAPLRVDMHTRAAAPPASDIEKFGQNRVFQQPARENALAGSSQANCA